MNLLCPYRFPHGKRKALVMSYDDGSEHDRRLVDIFDRYGIRASFHLNSGKLGLPHHIAPGELPTLYRNHEISCHSVNHPDLTQLPDEAIRREILDDRHALEDWSGRPVRGLAYPFGTFDDRILALLPELGIDLPAALECDDSGRNPAFEIAFSADGVIPFPQARNRGRTTFSISIRRKPWSVPYS